ncbi:MAG: hypothetical protein KatS3mg126_0676 [Lysobacteraceae bacterium]|nr:MAG: hypothetical protein KatS3mg126_0676 [Xanthomonadaceae bacterium]
MALRVCSGLLLAALAGLGPAEGQAQAVMRIDPAHSRAEFGVRVFLLRRIEGRFDYLQGELRQTSPGHYRIHVQVAVQSLVMRQPDHARWARSEEFFDAQRYPWIRFEAEDVAKSLLRDGGELPGWLVLRGVRQPVRFEVLPARCPRPGLDCPVEAQGEVERSRFGMDARRWAVSDRVRLRLHVVFFPAVDAAGAEG